MKLVYRILPFFIIVALMYTGSGWAKQTFFKVKLLVQTEAASWEMDNIKTQLEFDLKYRKGSLYDFDAFIRSTYPDNVKEMSTDPWGEEYYYEYEKGIYFLQSAGADGEFGTDDDMIVTNEEDQRM